MSIIQREQIGVTAFWTSVVVESRGNDIIMLTIKRITSNDRNVDESQLLAGIDFVPRGNSLEPPLLIQVVNILRFFQFLQGTISNISFFFLSFYYISCNIIIHHIMFEQLKCHFLTNFKIFVCTNDNIYNTILKDCVL